MSEESTEKEVYVLCSYQERDIIRGNLRNLLSAENVKLRMNYIPEGSIVFMTGINVESERRCHGENYNIRDFSEIYTYLKKRSDIDDRL